MIYKIPKHKMTIDLSKVTAISWEEHVPAIKVSLWTFFLTFGWRCSSPKIPARVRINPDRHHTANFKYDTDKEAKKVYNDLVKAWEGE